MNFRGCCGHRLRHRRIPFRRSPLAKSRYPWASLEYFDGRMPPARSRPSRSSQPGWQLINQDRDAQNIGEQDELQPLARTETVSEVQISTGIKEFLMGWPHLAAKVMEMPDQRCHDLSLARRDWLMAAERGDDQIRHILYCYIAHSSPLGGCRRRGPSFRLPCSRNGRLACPRPAREREKEYVMIP